MVDMSVCEVVRASCCPDLGKLMLIGRPPSVAPSKLRVARPDS